MDSPIRADIPKEELVKIIKRLLDAPDDLDFLAQLEQDDLERILVVVRARIEGIDKSP
jgi:hypothetical protein